MNAGSTYVKVATEHREAIELAREVSSSDDTGAFSSYFADALVAIDDAMRAELAYD